MVSFWYHNSTFAQHRFNDYLQILNLLSNIGREIRRVLENWEHPKKTDGEYEALFADYVRAMDYYKDEVVGFIEKMQEVITKGETTTYNRTWNK